MTLNHPIKTPATYAALQAAALKDLPGALPEDLWIFWAYGTLAGSKAETRTLRLDYSLRCALKNLRRCGDADKHALAIFRAGHAAGIPCH
jgi:hypothetical protein